MERKQYKALNFDLDTQSLRDHYPSKHYRQAYRDISRFLQTNGFEHRQWSGYRSTQALSDAEITLLITQLNSKFKWLAKCVKRFDVTNIGRNYDLSVLFADIAPVPDLVPDLEPVPPKPSMLERYDQIDGLQTRKSTTKRKQSKDQER